MLVLVGCNNCEPAGIITVIGGIKSVNQSHIEYYYSSCDFYYNNTHYRCDVSLSCNNGFECLSGWYEVKEG